MLFPFICRERFFYYLVGFVYRDTFKNIIKLGMHMPRPLWIWSDIQCYAAEGTLAAPSGHTARASFLTMFLVLDLFFASGNSRRQNPSSNKMTISKNYVFAAILVILGVIYFAVLWKNVFFMGQHTYDQLLLGTQYGLWMALYLHFGWRDHIHEHINYLMNVPRLTIQKAHQYLTVSSIVFGLTVSTIFCEILYLRYTWIIP